MAGHIRLLCQPEDSCKAGGFHLCISAFQPLSTGPGLERSLVHANGSAPAGVHSPVLLLQENEIWLP